MQIRTAMVFFVLGVIFGASMCNYLPQENANSVDEIKAVEKVVAQPNYANSEYLSQIASLELKIKELNDKLNTAQQKPINTQEKSKNKNVRKVKTLTKELLLKAGIDEMSALEIIRRKDEYEYKQLELRDQSASKGSVGRGWFRKELNNLKRAGLNIREDLGDDVYDRYLYASGKSNRVKISSIMRSSPAEYTGIVTGDEIFSYNEKRVFSWKGLNKLTAKVQKEESAILNVKRNGEIFNILVPGGSLGVRLAVDRVLPE